MEKVLSRAEKINSLGILTAGIAHEINNPLTGISNAIQILKKSTLAIEKREDLLDLVLTNIGRISRIIEDLRVFSRQERVETGSFSLIPAIEETLKLLSYQKENDQIKIDFEHSNEDLSLVGSKNQFQQVMVNLLLNSSQAIFGEGFIKVRLVKDTDKGTVFIEIKDSGCGIPESQIEQIFDPFFTTKRDWNGTGLGLAVSYRLVQLLKGTITVKSKENVGTSFRLNFPLVANS
jgi:two-component system NtrC family sensor kinase